MSEPNTIGGRYEIGELLGQGGFATVYHGVDTLTEQKVAIKLLKPEVIALDPDIVERFKREGEALRRLNHPNIVSVLAAFQDETGDYVVMEYVGGGDLYSLLNKHRQADEMIPVDRVLEIALDLSDALARAHRLKIVHRDIKPANVLLASDGTPRLTDFGVAHFGDSTRMTQTGAMIGTMAYLSPEGCMGEEIDARSDVWSFGVMLYELLTLQRPFQESNSVALLNAILTKDPAPIQELRSDIPDDLAALVHHMLVKNREERLHSVRLVGARVEALMSGAPITPIQELTPPESVSVAPPTPIITPSEPTATITATRPTIWLAVVAFIILAVITALLISLAGSETESAPLLLDPVPEDTYMIIVAQMEPLTDEERDVSRFIVEDLRRTFEEDVPFSTMRIREYDGIITSADEANAVAEANDAPIIIWGNYDDDGITLQMQLGSLAAFPDQPFDRDELQSMTNVELYMTNERRESLAASVVAIMNNLHTANNNIYEIALNLAILQIADPISPEVIGNSVASNWHRYLVYYYSDPQLGFESVNQAIELESTLPILYLGRTLSRQITGEFAGFYDDIETAQQLAPEGWYGPELALLNYLTFVENDPEAAREAAAPVVESVDNWWVWTQYAVTNLVLNDLEGTRYALERAIAYEPPANFPYVLMVTIHFREGNLPAASELLHFITVNFPDPTFANRLLQAAYGTVPNGLVGSMEAFGYLTLRQWNQVITSVDAALEIGNALPEVYVMKGIAQCNLGLYQEAETAYTELIRQNPDYILAYVLRAEVRLAQDEPARALLDIREVMQSDQAELFTPYLPAFQSGEINCTNFLDVDWQNP